MCVFFFLESRGYLKVCLEIVRKLSAYRKEGFFFSRRVFGAQGGR